jgi:hypothetical protein
MKKPKKHVHQWKPVDGFMNAYLDSGYCDCGKQIWEVYLPRDVTRILNAHERNKRKGKR